MYHWDWFRKTKRLRGWMDQFLCLKMVNAVIFVNYISSLSSTINNLVGIIKIHNI